MRASRFGPTALLIGIAPPAVSFPPSGSAHRARDRARARHLERAPHLHRATCQSSRRSRRSMASRIHDLRRPPANLHVVARPRSRCRRHGVLTVGTDCNIGKMTTQLQLIGALRERGIRTALRGHGADGHPHRWPRHRGGCRRRRLHRRRGRAARARVGARRRSGARGRPGLDHPSELFRRDLRSAPRLAAARAGDVRPAVAQGDQRLRMGEDPAAPRFHPPQRGRRGAAAAGAGDRRRAQHLRPRTTTPRGAWIETTARETGLPTTDPVRFDPAPLVDAIASFMRATGGDADGDW